MTLEWLLVRGIWAKNGSRSSIEAALPTSIASVVDQFHPEAPMTFETKLPSLFTTLVLSLGACQSERSADARLDGSADPTPRQQPVVPPSPTGSRIAVANRGSDTVTLIDVASERRLQIELGDGAEPMYAQNPFFSDEIWIGDRANDRVLVYDALRLRRVAEIPVGRGLFHMWNNGALGQMWAVNDVDRTITVIGLSDKQVLATASVPDDLVADFQPHDITVTADAGIVTLLGAGQSSGWLVKYSGETFAEVARLEVGPDPHLFYWGFASSKLYAATQGDGKVLELDPDTLTITDTLDIPGAHGIWADESETYLYVTDITSADGSNSLYTIDVDSFELVPGSPVSAPLANPHNVMVSIDNRKLFITHSSSSFTSIYDIDDDGLPGNARVVETGPVPFGIMLVRDPLCEIDGGVGDDGDSDDDDDDDEDDD